MSRSRDLEATLASAHRKSVKVLASIKYKEEPPMTTNPKPTGGMTAGEAALAKWTDLQWKDRPRPHLFTPRALSASEWQQVAAAAIAAHASEVEGLSYWLIERIGVMAHRHGKWLCLRHSRWTIQNAVEPLHWENWTDDASKALRFARKQDAEAFVRFEGYSSSVTVTEHRDLARLDARHG